MDITVFRLNWQEHLQHLEEMLVQNQQAGFKVKLKNVVLAKATLSGTFNYLGIFS